MTGIDIDQRVADVDPERLVAAMLAFGFERAGGQAGLYERVRWPCQRGALRGASLTVPLNAEAGDYADLLRAVLLELDEATERGRRAGDVLSLLGRAVQGARHDPGE